MFAMPFYSRNSDLNLFSLMNIQQIMFGAARRNACTMLPSRWSWELRRYQMPIKFPLLFSNF